MLTQLYEKLSARRDALVALYGHRSGLRDCNPDAYSHYLQEIRDLNRQLRLLRVRLMNNSGHLAG
ncbi:MULTISPECIES: hypothetical protein [Spirosoma]|uniref:Uncharacterized protein n=2 Tax=Spirosoma TaxID=107 RepID=A0A6G9AKC6_9BACT|nr:MULTISPECIES: hypothetical protein [Spirosoma]QHV94446.1 hypothetical protein GJR95_05170 [Spirosoma endbachense]QIP12880.1 hypothetical protein G8759_09705 [Spirosoma aureum]